MPSREQFERGQSVNAPKFRQQLNAIAGQSAAFGAPGSYQSGHAGNNTGAMFGPAGPLLMKLFESPASGSWTNDTHDGIVDDVKSATCGEVYLDQQTNTYSKSTEYEQQVYNSPGGEPPGEGDRFWAALNIQSGRWEVVSGSSGAEMIRFTIDSADCDADPKSASVNVDAIICSGASVAIDDTVTVYDKAGCLLNEPEADLAGRVGFAVKLDDGVACEWEVLQMCCPTNQCS